MKSECPDGQTQKKCEEKKNEDVKGTKHSASVPMNLGLYR